MITKNECNVENKFGLKMPKNGFIKEVLILENGTEVKFTSGEVMNLLSKLYWDEFINRNVFWGLHKVITLYNFNDVEWVVGCSDMFTGKPYDIYLIKNAGVLYMVDLQTDEIIYVPNVSNSINDNDVSILATDNHIASICVFDNSNSDVLKHAMYYNTLTGKELLPCAI